MKAAGPVKGICPRIVPGTAQHQARDTLGLQMGNQGCDQDPSQSLSLGLGEKINI